MDRKSFTANNSAHDSPALLAFWWYASCCRHLGIGGLAEVTGAPATMAGGALTIDLDLPPLSPLVVAIDTRHSRAGSA